MCSCTYQAKSIKECFVFRSFDGNAPNRTNPSLNIDLSAALTCWGQTEGHKLVKQEKVNDENVWQSITSLRLIEMDAKRGLCYLPVMSIQSISANRRIKDDTLTTIVIVSL